MIKKFFLFISLIGFTTLYADMFTPLHASLVSKLLRSKEFLQGNSDTPIESSSFYENYPHALSSTGDDTGFAYYPNGWMKYKYYIPAGTKVSVVMSTAPNSCFRVHLSYRGPINHATPSSYTSGYMIFHANEVNQALLNGKTIEFFTPSGTMNYEVYNTSSEGGWIYFNMVEDSIFAPSSPYGRKSDGYLYFTVRYRLLDREKFKNWLYSTPLLSENGNPSAFVSTIHEYDVPSPGQIADHIVQVDTGHFFYNGPDPFDSAFDIDMINQGKAIQCASNEIYENGKCVVAEISIDPSKNSNATTNINTSVSTAASNSSGDKSSPRPSCPNGFTYSQQAGMCIPSNKTQQKNSNATTNINTSVSTAASNSSGDKSSPRPSCPNGFTYSQQAGMCIPSNKTQQKNSNATTNINTSVAKILRELQQKSPLSVNGYLAYYGPEKPYDPFAWLYVDSSYTIVAKLDGMNNDGTFKWLVLKGTDLRTNKNMNYVKDVRIENGKIVLKIDSDTDEKLERLRRLCLENGFEWDSEHKICKFE